MEGRINNTRALSVHGSSDLTEKIMGHQKYILYPSGCHYPWKKQASTNSKLKLLALAGGSAVNSLSVIRAEPPLITNLSESEINPYLLDKPGFFQRIFFFEFQQNRIYHVFKYCFPYFIGINLQTNIFDPWDTVSFNSTNFLYIIYHESSSDDEHVQIERAHLHIIDCCRVWVNKTLLTQRKLKCFRLTVWILKNFVNIEWWI